MNPEIDQLLTLQDRDQRIKALKTELKNVPLERKEFDAKLALASTGAEKSKAHMLALEVEKKRLEVESAGKREQIGKFKTQQMQTRKNEEFQAFTQQIEHFEQEISKLEDRELEIMEAMEAHKPVLAAAERAAADAKALVARQIADLDERAAALNAQLKEAESTRADLTTGIDEDLLDQYNRLFASKNGQAVVLLEHEVCTGCHMKLTTQTVANVRAQKHLVRCEQCGRILYWA